MGTGSQWYYRDQLTLFSNGNTSFESNVSIGGDVDISGELLSGGDPIFDQDVNSGSSVEFNDVTVSSVANAGSDQNKFLVLDNNNEVNYRTGPELLADLSGDCGGTFSWNNKSLSDIGTILVSNIGVSTLTSGFFPYQNSTGFLFDSNISTSGYPDYDIKIDGDVEVSGEFKISDGADTARFAATVSTVSCTLHDGASAITTGTAYFYRSGKVVTVSIPQLTGTLTGGLQVTLRLDTELPTPAIATQYFAAIVRDEGTDVSGRLNLYGPSYKVINVELTSNADLSSGNGGVLATSITFVEEQ